MLERFYIKLIFRRSNGHVCPGAAYANNWGWDEPEEKLYVDNSVFEGISEVRIQNAAGEVLLEWKKAEILNA